MGRIGQAGILGLLATLAAAPAQAQQPPAAVSPFSAINRASIEALATPANISGPVLSPDGRRVAALANINGKNGIAIYDLQAPPTVPPQLTEERNFTTRWIRWASGNTLLIGVLLTRSFYGLTVPLTRIIAVDVATGQSRPLDTGNGLSGDDVLHIDPAGRFVIVSAQDRVDRSPGVIRVDLATGNSTPVLRPRDGVWRWYTDNQGVVRAGLITTDRRTRLFYRPTAEADWRMVVLARGDEDGVIDKLGFAAAGDRGVIVTDSVTGRFAAYAFDFATGTRGAALFEHPTADVTAVELDENGQALGFTYEDERPHTFWTDPQQRAAQAAIDRALPGKTNIIVSRSAGSAKMLVWSGGADDPGAYYIYDRAARRMEPFALRYERLQGAAFAEVRPVTFAARDGTNIPAYLTLPRGSSSSNLPLVLLAHGGPFARDSWTFDPEVQILASLGYAVLQPNFRGSTGYGRAFVEKGYGQFGTGMIDDMEDGIAWLASQGTIDPARVCIMGSSYGGYAAIWAAMRAARPYRCAISFAGVSDLPAMMSYSREQFVASRYARAWQRHIQGEGAERVGLDAISPVRHADQLHVPVLIAHGENDQTVPADQSRELVKALGDGHVQVESVFYPEAVHGFTRSEDAIDFYRRVQAFLAQHNPAGPAPAAAGVSQTPRSR
jgi:dipeptidyl aminopeptidase/acylaminoacyl peptidase